MNDSRVYGSLVVQSLAVKLTATRARCTWSVAWLTGESYAPTDVSERSLVAKDVREDVQTSSAHMAFDCLGMCVHPSSLQGCITTAAKQGLP